MFLRNIIFGIIAAIAGLAVFQALFFIWTSSRLSDASEYDAIVVFAGSSNRVQRAYQLARQKVAPVLIISPASKRSISYYEKRFGKPGNASYILEEQADTTFMNAFYSAKLIKARHFKSVLLITSDYHMPRSFFLLKLALFSADCRVGMHKVDTRSSNSQNWQYRITRLKLSYNEMVQLWGSLVEGGLNYLGGPKEWLKTRSSGVARWLRELLLFDVPCPDCG